MTFGSSLSHRPPGGSWAAIGTGIAAAVGSAILGLLAVFAPQEISLSLLGLGTLLLAAVVLRYAVRASGTVIGRDRVRQEGGPGDRTLRWSRGVFYLGAATVTETTLRPVVGLTVSELLFLGAFTGAVFA